MSVLVQELIDRLNELAGGAFYSHEITIDELACQIFDDTGVSEAMERHTLERELAPKVALLLHELEKTLPSIDQRLRDDEFMTQPAMLLARKLAATILGLLTAR